MLHFPAPPSIQSNFRVNLGRRSYDCFLPPSFSCVCFQSITYHNDYIPYCHGLMETSLVNEGVHGVRDPVVIGTTRPEMGIVNATDSIIHVAHSSATMLICPDIVL